jgi:HTH-type transcriptional regulator/antitoxin HigA
MASRGWFDVPRKADVFEKVRDYFLQAAGPQFASAYHRKKMHGSSVPNEYALLAWQARILERARKLADMHNPPEFMLDDRWIADLIALTRRSDGPKRAQALLLSKGILLTIEKHLSGTYLDGGAMLDRDGRPVIGLTLRYDRLDNFWFVLFHELGHVFLHLMVGVRYDFFDEEGTTGNDTVEREADQFALDSLIPEGKWDECLSRFALSEEAVQIDAKNLGIDASIIAGRIRKERGDYTLLKNLVGQGQVASQFEDDGDELV